MSPAKNHRSRSKHRRETVSIVRGALVAYGLFNALSAAGCMQILGLEERSVATDAGARGIAAAVTGQCGGLPHPSAACAACMDTHCCAPARQCGSDPACLEASTCLAGCADAECRARCASFYTLPGALIDVRSCRVTQCASECGSSCGEAASSIASCNDCEQSNCCAKQTACAANAECAALGLCLANCFGVSNTCPTECQAQHPQGVEDFTALSACTSGCASSCVPGRDWSCLDRPIIWPRPKTTGSINFSITFEDFATERPFVGATVKACSKLDLNCTSPLSQSMTDTAGLVALTIPAGVAGFDGYLDISGGKVDGTGASTYPAIWYPVPFIVADGWHGKSTILSSEGFSQLALAIGVQIDPTRAHFAVNAADCNFGVAPEVSFATEGADQKTSRFYLNGPYPDTTATVTDGQTGVGGFLNLPVSSTGATKVVGIKAVAQAADGKTIGSLSFILRPATLTTMSSYPPIP